MKKKQYIYWFFLCLLGTSAVFLWHFFSLRNHCEIEIQALECFDTVYVPIEIEGKKYNLVLDLGMSLPGSLKKSVLEPLKKGSDGVASWKDFKGNWYQSPNYVIPKFHMGRARFSNVPFSETNEKFQKNVMTSPNAEKRREYEEKIDGLLGLGLFLEAKIPALFLDLGNKKAFLVRNVPNFHENGCAIANMVKIPFEKKYSVLVLEAETDLGRTRFILDTGSTQNLLKASLFPEKQIDIDRWLVHSSTFVLGEKNLGSEKFDLENMGSALEDIEGVLGMPFFKKYAILIDFVNGSIYIEPSKKSP